MMRCSITVLTWPHALLKGPRLGGFVRRHVPRLRASRFRKRAAAQEKDGMAEDELPEDSKAPQDARLASLDERLARAQAEEAERTATTRPDGDYRQGMRVLGELIGP